MAKYDFDLNMSLFELTPRETKQVTKLLEKSLSRNSLQYKKSYYLKCASESELPKINKKKIHLAY